MDVLAGAVVGYVGWRVSDALFALVGCFARRAQSPEPADARERDVPEGPARAA